MLYFENVNESSENDAGFDWPAQTRPLAKEAGPVGSPAGGLRRAGTRPGARVAALTVAVSGAVLLWLTCRLFLHTVWGQQIDERAVTGASYGRGKLWQLAEPVLDVVSVSFVVLGLGAAMVIALMRLRWGLALQVAVMVGGSNITTQLLKHQLLERPDLGVNGYHENNSLPSGHTTVAASVSMALVMVVPRRMRPAVAVLGAGYTAATGVSTLVGRWHRPSDVVAALLVVLIWSALVCALTPRSALDRGTPSGLDAPTVVGNVVLLGGGLAAAVVGYVVLQGGQVPLLSPQAAASGDVRAYLGLAALAVAATAGVFSCGLLVRQITARG